MHGKVTICVFAFKGCCCPGLAPFIMEVSWDRHHVLLRSIAQLDSKPQDQSQPRHPMWVVPSWHRSPLKNPREGLMIMSMGRTWLAFNVRKSIFTNTAMHHDHCAPPLPCIMTTTTAPPLHHHLPHHLPFQNSYHLRDVSAILIYLTNENSWSDIYLAVSCMAFDLSTRNICLQNCYLAACNMLNAVTSWWVASTKEGLFTPMCSTFKHILFNCSNLFNEMALKWSKRKAVEELSLCFGARVITLCRKIWG